MNPTPWPYPGDAPTARARRVAHAYRTALHDVDPAACAAVDEAMIQWGQTWVVPRVIRHDDDDWLAVVDAADFAMVEPATLRTWRARGLIAGRRERGRWTYRAGDLIGLTGGIRRRKRRQLPQDGTDRPT